MIPETMKKWEGTEGNGLERLFMYMKEGDHGEMRTTRHITTIYVAGVLLLASEPSHHISSPLAYSILPTNIHTLAYGTGVYREGNQL